MTEKRPSEKKKFIYKIGLDGGQNEKQVAQKLHETRINDDEKNNFVARAKYSEQMNDSNYVNGNFSIRIKSLLRFHIAGFCHHECAIVCFAKPLSIDLAGWFGVLVLVDY